MGGEGKGGEDGENMVEVEVDGGVIRRNTVVEEILGKGKGERDDEGSGRGDDEGSGRADQDSGRGDDEGSGRADQDSGKALEAGGKRKGEGEGEGEGKGEGESKKNVANEGHGNGAGESNCEGEDCVCEARVLEEVSFFITSCLCSNYFRLATFDSNWSWDPYSDKSPHGNVEHVRLSYR